MMMKFFLVSLVATATAFSPSPMMRKLATKTALEAASSLPNPKDSWSDKPAYTPVSTKPVADRSVSWLDRQMMKDVMIDPDYTLTWAVALLGPLIMWYHPSYTLDGTPSLLGIAGGGFHILFAALLWVQTRRVRLVFEKDSFEFYNIKGYKLDLDKGAHLERKPDNYVAGTVNRWSYDKITNYGFFPSLQFPVICYFKETETPEAQWNKWFAAFDGYGRGQPHFFPGIGNVHQIKEQFEARGVKRKPVPTIKSKKQ